MNRQEIECQAKVLANQKLNDQTAILTLEAPQIALSGQPGQFVNLACDHFLRRPIGIMSRDQAGGTIQIGIRVVGEGTAWLAGRKPGDTVSALGPLGHGFELAGLSRVITVGGGTGVFPLYFVQQACQERYIESMAVCGFRSKAESILVREYEELSCRRIFASDRGDMDIAGHAGVGLQRLLLDLPPAGCTAILACGPVVMLKIIADIARSHRLPCQVSLEERMACGIGVCLVCACAVKSQIDDHNQAVLSYKRCCVDGPVFRAEEVEWPI